MDHNTAKQVMDTILCPFYDGSMMDKPSWSRSILFSEDRQLEIRITKDLFG